MNKQQKYLSPEYRDPPLASARSQQTSRRQSSERPKLGSPLRLGPLAKMPAVDMSLPESIEEQWRLRDLLFKKSLTDILQYSKHPNLLYQCK